MPRRSSWPYFGAVGELLTLLEGNGPDGRVLIGFDLFGHLIVDGTLGVVVDEAREDEVEDLAAAGLVGVGRDERVLGLGAVRRDDCVRGAFAGGRGIGGAARAGGQAEGEDGRDCQPGPLEVHEDSSD